MDRKTKIELQGENGQIDKEKKVRGSEDMVMIQGVAVGFAGPSHESVRE